jgi:hypothetical protein
MKAEEITTICWCEKVSSLDILSPRKSNQDLREILVVEIRGRPRNQLFCLIGIKTRFYSGFPVHTDSL